ncbi:BPSL0067 family protein [Duganella vulcania]|nr:BPSL0067 family protein [Duganella vulcania]
MMNFVYSKVASLDGKPKVGTKDCVALVQHYAHAPNHLAWRPGEKVLDNKTIRPGTAIATFENGRYPSRPKGNHAALYLRPGPSGDGFWVIDQWKDDTTKKTISSRYIPSRHQPQHKDGTWYRASDNADAFYVIETR